MNRVTKASPPARKNSGRGKRALIACDHCRSKRLKCSSEGKGKCTNCVLYDKRCEYQGSIFRLPSANSDEEDKREEIFPPLISSNDSPNQNFNIEGETSILTPDSSLTNDFDDPQHPLDELGMKLLALHLPIFTGLADDMPMPTLSAAQLEELPSQALMEELATVYAENIALTYPFLLPSDVREYPVSMLYADPPQGDFLDSLLIRLICCMGAMCYTNHDGMPAAELTRIRERLFGQVLAAMVRLFASSMRLKTAQIMFMMMLYCWQTQRFQNAWAWGAWTTRLTRALSLALANSQSCEDENHPNTEALNRLLWCILILEGQLCIINTREDPRFHRNHVQTPSDVFRKKHPIFCKRIELARLVNRFVRVLSDERFQDGMDAVHQQMLALRDSIPLEWRPEHDIFAEPKDHQAILMLHLEYHTMVVGFYSVLGAMSRKVPNPSFYAKFRTNARVINARRMLQTLDSIRTTPQFSAGLTCWITTVHIIPAFHLLYLHVMTNPSYTSSQRDMQLLFRAVAYLSALGNTKRTNDLAAVMENMCARVSSRIVEVNSPNAITPVTPVGGAVAEQVFGQEVDFMAFQDGYGTVLQPYYGGRFGMGGFGGGGGFGFMGGM